MAIRTQEQNGILIVSGPYSDMAKVYPKLKAMGFRYHPDDKSWRAKLDSLTPAKREKVKKILEVQGDPPPAVQAGPTKEEQKALRERFERVPTFGFTVTPHVYAVSVSGDTFDLKEALKAAGGRWGNHHWTLNFDDVDLKAVDKLLDAMEKLAHTRALRTEKIQKEMPASAEQWGDVKLGLQGVTLYVRLPRKEQEVLTAIRRFLPEAQYNTGTWAVAAYLVDLDDLKGLRTALSAWWEKESQQPPKETKRVNQRGGTCLRCRGWVEPGEGWLVSRFDDDDEKTIWLVEHKDKKVCEANIELAKLVAQKARTRDQAKHSLVKLLRSRDHLHSSTEWPSGVTHKLDDMYSVVVEPGDKHAWLIEDNGKDGDDWSYNNVGGHSIGYRTEYTEEMKALLRIALGED